MASTSELLEILLASVRDGYVQVSAFVAVTVLVFGYLQYRTDGRLVAALARHERYQPLAGACMGLTPGCGGAIVMMPLYVRGSVSFGTVVATLIATAGDSAFVMLALAPEAALYAYAIAFLAAVGSGYAIDAYGMGVSRVDRAVGRLSEPLADGGVVTGGTLTGRSPPITIGEEGPLSDNSERVLANPEDRENAHEQQDSVGTGNHNHDRPSARGSALLTPASHVAHVCWWFAAAGGLVLGLTYLLRGAPEVPLVLGLGFAGLFTIVGLTGTTLSIYLHFVGRRYIGGEAGHAADSFGSTYDTLRHAALETSFVTVWVLVAYLAYEYAITLTGIDVAASAAAAGVLAPIGGALIGLIPGCGPQIVLASAYTQGAIPFSALVANAISQDGDALFPLLAIDKKAAIIASIYTTIPALIVGVGLYYLLPVFGVPQFGFGVLG